MLEQEAGREKLMLLLRETAARLGRAAYEGVSGKQPICLGFLGELMM